MKTMVDGYKSYEEAWEKFRWNQRWEFFDGNEENFNIAHECVDRHPRDKVGIRIQTDDDGKKIYTFGEFSDAVAQFANYLKTMGIEFGDAVAVLLPPCFEFYVGMFGVFKRGAIVIPCSPQFGPEAISFRVKNGGAKVVLTTKDKANLVEEDLREKLNLKIIFAEDLLQNMADQPKEFKETTTASDLAMYQFSSGTTGEPKAVNYRHGAITVSAPFMKFAQGIRSDDSYFCPSSPAWGHGIWYGTIAPLIFGTAVGTYSYKGKFNPDRCLEAMQDFKATNVAAISSHYRLMINSPNIDNYDIHLKRLTYTGEPMSKDVFKSIQEKWGVTPHGQYGTTEVGPITSDFAGFENWKVKQGSLGKPSIGSIVSVIDEDGNEVPVGTVGQMAIKRNNKWIRVGDMVYKDEDGYFWYVSRADDVIISSGYTIGPLEIEATLLKYEAVDECAVVASPDRDRGTIVKAFIVCKEGYTPGEELDGKIREFVKDKLSKHEYPREIEFVDELPKTPDGKIRRKVLKELELERKKDQL